ncbi:hypothetical protein DL96DRAFT_1720032 [Flagelloscypha sp. PMI_526]|nr:hypothetical protein DL96DRAFT_1720032 [Flagelloscypha sp. PMI_526]
MPVFTAKDKFDCSKCLHGVTLSDQKFIHIRSDKILYPYDQSPCPLWKNSITELTKSVPKFREVKLCSCEQYPHALVKTTRQYIHKVEKDQYIDCIQQPCPFGLAHSITEPTESYLPVSPPESKPLRVRQSKTPSKTTTPVVTSPHPQERAPLEILPLEEDFDCRGHKHAILEDTGKYIHILETCAQYCWEQPCDRLPLHPKTKPSVGTPESNFADQLSTALTFPERSTSLSLSPTHTPLEYLPSQPHTPPASSTMATPVDPQYIQVLQRLTDALDGLTIAPGPGKTIAGPAPFQGDKASACLFLAQFTNWAGQQSTLKNSPAN